MEQFLFAHAAAAAPADLVANCILQFDTVPDDVTLGFAYATDDIADQFDQVLADLRHAIPQVQWVGTVGMGLCAGDTEIYDQPALTLLLTDISPENFRILPGMGPESDAAHILEWCDLQDFCFAFVHGNPANPKTPELIDELVARPAIGFVNGGLSSSQHSNPQLAGRLTGADISGVVFNQAVTVATDHTQGCSLIGPPHDISEAQRNVVATLDQQPALDVLKQDVGEVMSKDLSQLGGYIFAALPIRGSDTGDYMVRTILAVDTDNGLIAVGDMLEDKSQLMFCRRDGNSAHEDMQAMLTRLKKRLSGQRIRGGIYVSCLGRGRNQFGDDSEELRLIRQHLGEFPLVGFFANGEIYSGRIYGYTGVLTLFI